MAIDMELTAVFHEDMLRMEWHSKRADGCYVDVSLTPEKPEAAFNAVVQKFGLQSWRATTYGTGRSEWMYAHATFLKGSLTISVHDSKLEDVRAFVATIPELQRYISWYYQDDDGIDSVQFPLRGPFPADAFYPWMDRPLAKLADDFLKSTANALLLIGPPGTGKTSFIKALVNEMNADAWLTYDSALHKSDKLHKDFMRPTDQPRLLIMEDADVILSAREDGNDAMGRLLNLADGMVSVGQRKLVFSTNLPNLHSIDEALLRPGRCFGILKFRDMNRDEALAACESVGRELTIDMKEHETVSLATALNGRTTSSAVLKMGFN
jgi:hypothetical protein